MISAVRLAGFLAVVVGVAIGFADEKPKAFTDRTAGTISSREAAQTALTELNGLIGTWRGVGQPVRNSNKGSWTESAEWVWDLKSEQVSIRLSVKDGKLLRCGLLTWDADKKEYEFQATLPDQSQRTYRGALASKKLTLETAPGETGEIQQLVVTPLNEKRTLLMFQTKGKGQQQFNRVAEVGYTREGTRLADEGVGGPECIVTGGKGTMSTVYKGKTYWFCCTGCRDAFQDDPDGIIAQAAERAARKKTEKESNGKTPGQPKS